MPQGPLDQFARAVIAERAAWEAVRNRLPGSPTFSPALWAMWRAAVEESDYAARRAKAAAAKPARTANGTYAGKGWSHATTVAAHASRPQAPGDASA
jgi:hypothetical protein